MTWEASLPKPALGLAVTLQVRSVSALAFLHQLPKGLSQPTLSSKRSTLIDLVVPYRIRPKLQRLEQMQPPSA